MRWRKHNIALFLFVLSLVICSVASARPAARTQNSTITEQIQGKLEQASDLTGLWLGCELVHTSPDLIRFYRERGFKPVWVEPEGVNVLGWKLPQFLADTADHGLLPQDYHLACIRGLLEVIEKLASLAEPPRRPDRELPAQLDILLTDAFLTSASHLSLGKVSPETLYQQWLAPKNKPDIVSRLTRLQPDQDLFGIYQGLLPGCRRYRELLQAGQKLRAIVESGGWDRVPEGPVLGRGDTDPRVEVLRHRLDTSSPGEEDSLGAGNVFDAVLEETIKGFQARHGLKTDGVVGRQTLAALNVPARQRLQTVLLNLERLRWLSCDFGKRYLLVNIADFTLQAYEDRKQKLSLKVVVGKKYHKTPVFSQKLRYLVLNPYWNVPRSIAVKEILPKVKQNPEYLVERHYQLLPGWQGEPPLDLSEIDWSGVNSKNFSWRFRQEPGPWNSLGRIKFIFPNTFNVYIHDTPHKHLFEERGRAFSHGCIRVQHPLLLAAFVLKDDPDWSLERIREVLSGGERTVVNVPGNDLVDLTYATAWVDEAGRVNFRDDIYNRDQVLWEAMTTSSQEPRLQDPFVQKKTAR